MQFEDNPSPYVRFVKQADTPDAAPADSKRLFLDADGLANMVDEAGNAVNLETMQEVVTDIPVSIPAGKVVLYDDGATVHAYYSKAGVIKGPFPLFSYDS